MHVPFGNPREGSSVAWRDRRASFSTSWRRSPKRKRFRLLGDAWADTTTSHGRLMLTVLGGLAEFERDLIRARTGEGRARAVARGQKMGRPPKLTAHQQKEAIKRRDQGDETLANIANFVRQEVRVPKTKPLLPVFEAVSNALDAIADRKGTGTVRVTVRRHR